MSRQNRNYDKEFKLNAVQLCKNSEKSVAKIASDLGAPKQTLYQWVKDYQSDRGSEYISEDFRQTAENYKMRLSINSGSCYDNAPIESFFHTLKTEQVYFIGSKSREETKSAIFEFIEVFYNRQRSHSRLGYLSPHEFEKTRLSS